MLDHAGMHVCMLHCKAPDTAYLQIGNGAEHTAAHQELELLGAASALQLPGLQCMQPDTIADGNETPQSALCNIRWPPGKSPLAMAGPICPLSLWP